MFTLAMDDVSPARIVADRRSARRRRIAQKLRRKAIAFGLFLGCVGAAMACTFALGAACGWV